MIGGLIWTLLVLGVGISIGRADRLIADVHYRLKEKRMKLIVLFTLVTLSCMLSGCLTSPASASPPQDGSIEWLWNHTGSWLAWYDNDGHAQILPPSEDYVQVFPGGEVIFTETCHPNGITLDHYLIHGDSLEVYQDFWPGDVAAKPSTWGMLKDRYR